MVEETKQAAETVGAIGSLGINGKLFLAQLVNFSVIVFVMWRWVYRPLLRIMDERSKRMEQGLKDAAASAAARAKAEEEGAGIVVDARIKAKEIIERASTDAESERQASLLKARTEVEKVIAQGKTQLREDKQRMIEEVRSEIAGLVALAAGKVLRQKLDDAADARLIRESVSRADDDSL